eukprot:TRINITY_DN25552_c0_g1_i1.p3 TRINITY_DN25552_c0_g1~~TRINITY_DN25552_c0_g1_i1.p3  ORF type:complete len:125 (+),score=12.08 TRINITY_DN25552_c0_g1_i1:32-406(+)
MAMVVRFEPGNLGPSSRASLGFCGEYDPGPGFSMLLIHRSRKFCLPTRDIRKPSRDPSDGQQCCGPGVRDPEERFKSMKAPRDFPGENLGPLRQIVEPEWYAPGPGLGHPRLKWSGLSAIVGSG